MAPAFIVMVGKEFIALSDQCRKPHVNSMTENRGYMVR